SDSNDGTLPMSSCTFCSSALTFGSQSGEGIGSQRMAGDNRFGLDFYTGFLKRLSITQAGNVGIGTAIPTWKLEVANARYGMHAVGTNIGVHGITAGEPGCGPPFPCFIFPTYGVIGESTYGTGVLGTSHSASAYGGQFANTAGGIA